MVDGQLGNREWSDAAQFSLGDRARVFVKQRDGYVYIAIEWLTGDMFTVDAYLAPADGKLYDLHSSAKIGERTLQNGAWPEEWTWWNNSGWVANWSRVDQWKPVKFMPEKVREFQIARERFAGDKWKIMFELMAPADPNWKTYTFPPEAKNNSAENWITLLLDDSTAQRRPKPVKSVH